jgi:uncharacterized protein YodC (DUF2158 family)
MTYEAGNVVTLKSGGQPMTVVSVTDENVECIWIGEEGEFFRETIPAVALLALSEEDPEEDEDEDEAEDSEDDEEETKNERTAA